MRFTPKLPQLLVDGSRAVRAGVSDNAPALQALVDTTAAAGGGLIQLPNGAFNFLSGVNWRSKVGLIGSGATVLLPQGQFSGGVIQQLSNGPITAGPTALATAVPLTDCLFERFEIDGSGYTNTTSSISSKGMFIIYMQRAIFRNLYIHHCIGTGLGCDFLDDTLIDGVIAHNNGRLWSTSTVFGGQSGIGIGTGWKGVETVTISNCHTNNNGNYGVFVETQEGTSQTMYPRGARMVANYAEANRIGFGNKGSGGTTFSACEAQANVDGFVLNGLAIDDLLTGCISENNTRHGLYIPNHQGTVQVAGGRFRKNTGVGIRADNQASMKGFHVTGAQVSRNGLQGVVLGGGIENYSVKASTVQDNGQLQTSGSRAGILLGGTMTSGEIKGNRIGNSSGGTTQTEPVAGSSLTGTGLTISNNDLQGNTSSIGTLFAGLGNVTGATIANNPGYNDLDAPTVLTAGASPWAYTNGQSPSQLYLIGAGITVQIGTQNVTSGASSAQLTLPANKTVTITYTTMTAAKVMRI